MEGVKSTLLSKTNETDCSEWGFILLKSKNIGPYQRQDKRSPPILKGKWKLKTVTICITGKFGLERERAIIFFM